jgi:DNA-binding MarR family transcriptional regulator
LELRVPSAPTTVDAARLRLALMRLSRRLRQEVSAGLTPSQLSALARLDRGGPMSLRDLAAAERITPSTLTRIVASLEAEGLISREPDPDDRRVARVAVTVAGHALLEAARARGTGYLLGRIGDLGPDEADLLAAAVPVLERLLEDDA